MVCKCKMHLHVEWKLLFAPHTLPGISHRKSPAFSQHNRGVSGKFFYFTVAITFDSCTAIFWPRLALPPYISQFWTNPLLAFLQKSWLLLYNVQTYLAIATSGTSKRTTQLHSGSPALGSASQSSIYKQNVSGICFLYVFTDSDVESSRAW